MNLLKIFTFKNKVLTWALALLIIAVSVGFMGYMVGKFIWYITH